MDMPPDIVDFFEGLEGLCQALDERSELLDEEPPLLRSLSSASLVSVDVNSIAEENDGGHEHQMDRSSTHLSFGSTDDTTNLTYSDTSPIMTGRDSSDITLTSAADRLLAYSYPASILYRYRFPKPKSIVPENQLRRMQEPEEEQLKQCTFSPQISKKSCQIAAAARQGDVPFHERLGGKNEIRRRQRVFEKRMRRAEITAMAQCVFSEHYKAAEGPKPAVKRSEQEIQEITNRLAQPKTHQLCSQKMKPVRGRSATRSRPQSVAQLTRTTVSSIMAQPGQHALPFDNGSSGNLTASAQASRGHNKRDLVIHLQAIIRRWLCRRNYLEKKQAVVVIQAAWRMHRERSNFRAMRCASIGIQAAFRRHRQQRNYLRLEQTAISMQTSRREFVVQRQLLHLHQTTAAAEAQLNHEKDESLGLAIAKMALGSPLGSDLQRITNYLVVSRQ